MILPKLSLQCVGNGIQSVLVKSTNYATVSYYLDPDIAWLHLTWQNCFTHEQEEIVEKVTANILNQKEDGLSKALVTY